MIGTIIGFGVFINRKEDASSSILFRLPPGVFEQKQRVRCVECDVTGRVNLLEAGFEFVFPERKRETTFCHCLRADEFHSDLDGHYGAFHKTEVFTETERSAAVLWPAGNIGADLRDEGDSFHAGFLFDCGEFA